MDINKYKQSGELLRNIDGYKRQIKKINDFLEGSYDRVSVLVRNLLEDDYNYDRLNNVVNDELKIYRNKIRDKIEQLEKEFEAL